MRGSRGLIAFAWCAGLATLVLAAGCRRTVSPDEHINVPKNPVGYDPPGQYPDIAWIGSVEEARVRASEEHKPMIVFVRAAWSKPSIVMDSTIWQDARVLAEAGRFVALRVDLTANYDGQVPESLKDFDIRGVPTTIVVSSSGQILGRFGVGKGRAAEIAAAMKETQ